MILRSLGGRGSLHHGIVGIGIIRWKVSVVCARAGGGGGGVAEVRSLLLLLPL